MRYYEIIAEDGTGTIPTRPTLTPDQARRRAERQRKLQQKIRDTQAAASKKVSDLRAKVSEP